MLQSWSCRNLDRRVTSLHIKEAGSRGGAREGPARIRRQAQSSCPAISQAPVLLLACESSQTPLASTGAWHLIFAARLPPPLHPLIPARGRCRRYQRVCAFCMHSTREKISDTGQKQGGAAEEYGAGGGLGAVRADEGLGIRFTFTSTCC